MRPAPAKLQWAVVTLLLIAALPVVLSRTSWCYGVLLGGAVLLSRRTQQRPSPPGWLPSVVRAAVILSLAWAIIDWRLFGRPSVLVIAHFLLLITCCKLFEPRRSRDLGLLLLVSLMLLLVGGIVSAELAFPVSLAGFVLLGPYAGLLLHLQQEQERAGQLPGTVAGPAGRADSPAGAEYLSGVSVVIGVCCVLFGVAFFFVFPRFSGRSTRWLAPARSLTGFSSDANLDTAGPITESNELILRVQVTRAGEPMSAGAVQPYLRAFACSRYGRVRPPRLRPQRRSYGWPERYRPAARDIRLTDGDQATDLLEVASDPDPQQELRYDIIQERRLQGHLFAPYPPLAIYSPQLSGVRKVVGDQSLRAVYRSRGTGAKYSVWVPATLTAEQVEALAAERGPFDRPTSPPPESVPVGQPVRRLALQLWEDAGQPDVYEPRQRVQMLNHMVAYLRSERFAYTLDLPERPDQAEPVEHFLFSTRRGHCEIYATTMAVLCHILGIPARYVSGYLASDYNPVAHTFLVREEDAHAWVEAFVPGRDWVRFDPTPLRVGDLAEDSLLQTLRDYLEYWRFQWISLVVSYDALQREELLSRLGGWMASLAERSGSPALGKAWERWRDLLGGPTALSWGWRLLYWLVVGLSGALAVLMLRMAYRLAAQAARLLRQDRPSHPGRVYYERLVRALTTAGFRPTLAQTPREFVQGAVRRRPVLAPAARVVERYYAIRYGGRPLGRAEQIELARLLGELEAVTRR